MSAYAYLFGLAKNDPQVVAFLGSNPLRFFRFGHAPQNENRPYAVYRRVYGNPDNSLSCIPREDLHGIQVDVYAKTDQQCLDAADAIRDSFEAEMVSLQNENGDDWEKATGLYYVSRTYEFWMARPSS